MASRFFKSACLLLINLLNTPYIRRKTMLRHADLPAFQAKNKSGRLEVYTPDALTNAMRFKSVINKGVAPIKNKAPAHRTKRNLSFRKL
jgi:hypothetical protein